MGVSRDSFGKVEGREVWRYTLSAGGLSLAAINYGAIVTSLLVPDAQDCHADVVTGYDDLAGYLACDAFFGATVGRVANRINNGECTFDGRRLALATNDAPHHLHGGPTGFNTRLWQGEVLPPADGNASVRFTYASPDGEEGYPGNLQASVTYTLTSDAIFVVEMAATTDAPTLVNMAHHSYWNLGGHDSGSIENHELQLAASNYTPGSPVVPEGQEAPVSETPFDFRTMKPVGRDIEATSSQPSGYDHNFVVDGDPSELRQVALLLDPASGRELSLSANQPGVQLYSGNFLDGSKRGKGATYGHRHALCLETQAFPNAANVPEWIDQVRLLPGRRYHHVMRHRFAARAPRT